MTNEKNVRKINFGGYVKQTRMFDQERSELHRMLHEEDMNGLCDVFSAMNFTSPEYLIDVLIPALHSYAVEYAQCHELRSSTEFTVELYNALIMEMARYGTYLVEEESHG